MSCNVSPPHCAGVTQYIFPLRSLHRCEDTRYSAAPPKKTTDLYMYYILHWERFAKIDSSVDLPTELLFRPFEVAESRESRWSCSESELVVRLRTIQRSPRYGTRLTGRTPPNPASCQRQHLSSTSMSSPSSDLTHHQTSCQTKSDNLDLSRGYMWNKTLK